MSAQGSPVSLQAQRSWRLDRRRAWLAAAILAGGWPAALALAPRQRSSQQREPVRLEQQLPQHFDGWRLDPRMRPLLPDPSLQSVLQRQYTQVLARSFRHADGGHAMLSVAYGDEQSGEATAVHRPEFCYRSQGFEVSDRGLARMALDTVELPVRRLIARAGPRIEPITYWMMLDLTPVLPGWSRRLAQWRLGLSGWRGDGMVLRVSSFGRDEAQAFAGHERFIVALHRSLPPPLQLRYFGQLEAARL